MKQTSRLASNQVSRVQLLPRGPTISTPYQSAINSTMRYLRFIFTILIVLALVSSGAAAQKITLDWNVADATATSPIGAARGFNIYRAMKPCSQVSTTDPSAYVKIATGITVLTYVDMSIPTGARHVCYVVTAYNNFNGFTESSLSNQAGQAFNVAPAAPSAPKFN